MKENGKLFAYEANRSNPLVFLLFTFANLSRKFLPIGYVEREFSVNERALGLKELERGLRDAGFTGLSFASINILNKDKDASQVIQRHIRNLLYYDF